MKKPQLCTQAIEALNRQAINCELDDFAPVSAQQSSRSADNRAFPGAGLADKDKGTFLGRGDDGRRTVALDLYLNAVNVRFFIVNEVGLDARTVLPEASHV